MNASGMGHHGWAPTNSDKLYGGGDGDVCVLAHAHACMHVRACMCAHACARMRMHACVMCLQYTIRP